MISEVLISYLMFLSPAFPGFPDAPARTVSAVGHTAMHSRVFTSAALTAHALVRLALPLPLLAQLPTGAISRPGGTVGWLWNLRSEWTTGTQRTQLYLIFPAHRLSARPDLARRAGSNARLGTGAPSPEPVKQATAPGRCSLNGILRRGQCLARGLRVNQGTASPFRLGPATSRATWFPV
jgi:hypothetical protein